RRRTLGKPMLNSRSLAVHPTGSFLAVAGGDSPEILLFPDADPRQEPKVLRGVGETIQTASFRRKGDSRGVLLTAAGGAKMIFDFTNRTLVRDDNTWVDFTPDPKAKGWNVEPSGWKPGDKGNDREVRLTVTGPGNF